MESILETKKIAQFKKDSQDWTELLGDIKFHADISADKETADKKNYQRYEELARKIATLRNQRIESSKAQIKGFNSDSVNVEAVYHVLMPTPKGENPRIFVGETTYLPVDIDNLVIEGSTTKTIQPIFALQMGNTTTSTQQLTVSST